MGQLKDLVVTGATRLLGKITTKDVEINGGLIINPGSKANFNEGIRINKSNAGWATLVLGGEPGSTSGTGSGIWSMHTNNGNFYLSHNGSNNGSPMIIGDKSSGWNIYGNTTFINNITIRSIIDFQSNNWTGNIRAKNANGDLRYEIYCDNNSNNVMDGKIGNVNLDVVKDNSGGRSRYIFGTDGTFTAAALSGTLYGTATHANVLNSYSDLTFGVNRLQYFNQSTSVTSGANVNANPFNDWFYIIRMNHANTSGYYVDLATCFHSNAMYYRRIASGTDHGWVRIIDSDNYSSYALPLTGGTINGSITVTGDVTVGGVSLKTSVSNGKTAVAGAITDMGVSTESSATFDTMAANIRSIIVGNATASYVLSGYTFCSNSAGRNVSGTLRTVPNYCYTTLYSTPFRTNQVAKKPVNANSLTDTKYTDITGDYVSVRSVQGYHAGTSRELLVLASSFGDATAEQVLSGNTFTSTAGVKVSGTMPTAKSIAAYTFNGSYFVKLNSLSQMPGSGSGGGLGTKIPKAYFDGENDYIEFATDTFGDAKPCDVIYGKTFTGLYPSAKLSGTLFYPPTSSTPACCNIMHNLSTASSIGGTMSSGTYTISGSNIRTKLANLLNVHVYSSGNTNVAGKIFTNYNGAITIITAAMYPQYYCVIRWKGKAMSSYPNLDEFTIIYNSNLKFEYANSGSAPNGYKITGIPNSGNTNLTFITLKTAYNN